MTPTRAESPIPLIVILPNTNSAPPIPRVSISDAMTRLRVLPRSTLFLTKVLMPTEAMVPNSRSIIPPNTASGIVLRIALTFPRTEKRIPKIPAILITQL